MTDKEIIKIAKSFTKGILGSSPTIDKCFFVCSPLAAYLSFCGIECHLTEGEINHCENELHHFWITLSDGRIIDPTADQFGLLNIWVKKQPSTYHKYSAKDYDERIKTSVRTFYNRTKPKQ